MFASLKRFETYAAFRHTRWQLQKAAKFEYHRLQARFQRSLSKATYIGVTGSSGKTTTTALTGHILSGVEKTYVQAVDNELKDFVKALRSTPLSRGYSIWEMGAFRPGSLKPLVELVQPQVGIVTLVALEHKSNFHTCEAVQEDKQTLVEALPSDGLAILNHDDGRVISMASRTKARVKTFGERGGDYVVSNICADNPAGLTLSISHAGRTTDLKTQLTGAHQSVPIAAAFACALELGVPASVCQERIASFKPVFGRCSVHEIENGPVFIIDSVKAPNHSMSLAINMMAQFKAPRKRIIIGQISDITGTTRTKYRDAYRASRDVADQVIFVGHNAHRSKATPEEISAGLFVQKHKIEDAARFVRETAIPGEIILLKSAQNLHLERVFLSFLSEVRCWKDPCKLDCTCVECGHYGRPPEAHPRELQVQRKSWQLEEVRDPLASHSTNSQ